MTETAMKSISPRIVAAVAAVAAPQVIALALSRDRRQSWH
jgi:hypothetical protein